MDNAVSANLLAAFGPAERVKGQPCNIGAGERTSLLDLVRLIGDVAGVDLAVAHLPSRAGDVRDSLASLDPAGACLGYRVLVPLRDGLRQTWEGLGA